MPDFKLLPDEEEKYPRFYYGYTMILASFLILAIAGGIQYSFGVFFKPVLNEFGWTRAETAGVYSLNTILNGASCIFAGRLCDRFGPRLVLTFSGLLVGLGYLLISQVSAIWQIYLFYGVLVSIGNGGIAVPLLSTVARWFVKKRGLASGIVMAGSGLGIVIMPPLATLLISSYGWRTSYVILGILAIVLISIIAQFLRRPHDQKSIPVPDAKALKTVNNSVQAQGLSLTEALRTRPFWIICMMSLVSAFGVQTVMVHIVAHATDINISAASAATILSVIGVISICGKVVMGSLLDRIGSRSIMIIIFILTSLSFGWLSLSSGLWMLYLFAALFGFSYGGYAAVQSPLVADLFGLRSHGAIFGSVMFALGLGGALGPLTTGYIFDINGSYLWAFILCAMLGLAGLIFSLLLNPARKYRLG